MLRTCYNFNMEKRLGEIKAVLDLPESELLSAQRRILMQKYLRNADRARCLSAGLMLCIASKELPDDGAAQI